MYSVQLCGLSSVLCSNSGSLVDTDLNHERSEESQHLSENDVAMGFDAKGNVLGAKRWHLSALRYWYKEHISIRPEVTKLTPIKSRTK